MKELKITPPEGYEVDTEKSTFEHIVFKPIQKQLPKSWEELGEINGWFVNNGSGIEDVQQVGIYLSHRNVFATKEQAEASVALAQLTQLREVYRQGWTPDWKDGSLKYSIDKYEGKIVGDLYFNRNYFLTFQSEEVRDQFLENFKNLIKKASPLLFG